jgi:hypothetical protein
MALLAMARLPWVLRIIAGVLMIAVGLRLAGLASALRSMEWLGHAVWGRVSGFASRLALARSLAGTFVFGLIWGWLPCGLVYSALAIAVTTGSAWGGAAAMTAFGVGTLPALATLIWTGSVVKRYARTREARWVAAAAMLLLGTIQIAVAGRSLFSRDAAPTCHQAT